MMGMGLNAAFYAANVRVNPMLRKHFATSRGEGRLVVDIGCGAGTNAAFMHARGFRVIAFDTSPLACRLVLDRFGIPVVQRDVRFVRLVGMRGLAIILCNYVLQNFSRKEGAALLHRIFGALPEGGMVMVSVFDERTSIGSADVARSATANGLTLIDEDHWYRRDEDHGMPHDHVGCDSLFVRS